MFNHIIKNLASSTISSAEKTVAGFLNYLQLLSYIAGTVPDSKFIAKDTKTMRDILVDTSNELSKILPVSFCPFEKLAETSINSI